MATEDFCLNLSPLPSPRWSPLCFPPSPPRPFLPPSSSMVMQYQGSNQSMDNPSQNQESDDMVDPPPYLAGDSALLQQLRQIEASDWRPRGGIMTMNNLGFEESNMGFYFPPSPTDFPLYPPLPSVFFGSSNLQNIRLAFSYQHILEDKSGALHVLNAVEFKDIGPMFDGFGSYVVNKFGDLDPIARAAGVVPKDMESLVNNILDADYDYDEREVTLRRINWLEQHDEDIVDQPVYEQVGVAHQLIQNRGGELDVIIGGGVFKINGLECSDYQCSPTSPETLLIFQAKCSFRVWLGHDGQCVAETRLRCSRLNIGSFTTVEDAVSAYELVVRSSGWEDLTRFLGLLGNETRSKLPLELPPPAQEEKPNEDFGLVCCNSTGNDEIEAFRTESARTGDCVMADQARLNSGCFGKRKTNRKNSGGERRNKKTNEVRIVIPLEDISQNKGMHLKDAANHLRVSQSILKYACPEYGIPRWPPHKLISQSHPEETPALVDQEGIPQLNSDTLPSNQALRGTIDTRVVVKGIHPPLFLPTAQHDNLDEDFGDEVEAVAMGSEGIGEGEMEEDQMNSRYLGKMKMKEKTSGGERGNKKTTGVRIAIPLEDILQTKEMPLKDAAKHLKVSKSTLKRACREYNIPRWPPRREHKLINQSCPNESPAVVDKEQIPQLNSDTLLPSNQVSVTIDTKSVIVKARFGSATMKFQLSWPWGMKELNEQVKKRLGDEAENYHIDFKDEDDEYIMIGCDEDLQDHIFRSNPLGTNSIEVFLQPK